MKVGRGIFLCCIIGGFAALLFLLSLSERRTGEGEEGEGVETEEDIFVEGLAFSEWEGDRLTWSMDAERARYSQKDERATLEEVEATFFPPTGGKMSLWANFLDYDLQTGNLMARDSVRAESDQGYVFSTESLLYNTDSRVLETDDKVTLKKDRLTIQGTGIKGSLADQRFRLLSSVRAVFAPQGAVPVGAGKE